MKNFTRKRPAAQPEEQISRRSRQLSPAVRRKLREDAERRERLGQTEEAIVLSLDQISSPKTKKTKTGGDGHGV